MMKQRPTIMRRLSRHEPDTVVAQLSDRLRELAYSSGPNAKLPTVRDICRTYGASQTSLYDALDELERQNLIYRRQGSGIYVSPRIFEKSIVLLVNLGIFRARTRSPFWDNLLALFVQESGSRQAHKNESFSIHIADSHEAEKASPRESFIDLVNAELVDAVLGVGLDEHVPRWLSEHGIPCAVYAGHGGLKISDDYPSLVRIAAQALAEQNCRKIAFWAPATSDVEPANTDEHEAYEGVLKSNGLVYNPGLVHDNRLKKPEVLGTFQEQGRQLAAGLARLPVAEWPDGIVINDDMMTLGAVVELRKSGILVGRDVKIASHANVGSQVLYGFEEDLTLVEVDPLLLVRTMFEVLEKAMAGEEVPEISNVSPKLRI